MKVYDATPKRWRIVRGNDKPIHGSCAIYFGIKFCFFPRDITLSWSFYVILRQGDHWERSLLATFLQLRSYCWWFVRYPANSPVEVGSALGGPAASPQVLVRGKKFHPKFRPKLKDSLADQLEQNNVVARDLFLLQYAHECATTFCMSVCHFEISIVIVWLTGLLELLNLLGAAKSAW